MKKLIAIFMSLVFITVTMANVYADNTSNVYESELDKYAEKYTGNDLLVDTDIPAGNYVIIPKEGKLAYVCIYEYGTTMRLDTGGKRFIYSKYTGCSDHIMLKKNQYVSISSGALVPVNSVEKRDIKRNGSFIVGTDIAPGHYTFRVDQSSPIGFVETTQLVDNPRISMYLLFEDSNEVTLKLDKGMVLIKYGIDILDANLRMYADYSPLVSIPNDTDEKYNFADVRDSYKSKVISEATSEMRYFEGTRKIGNRYLTSNINAKINSWKSIAANNAETKYAEMVGSVYNRFALFATYSNPEVSKNNQVEVYNKRYSGTNFAKWLESHRDAYIQIAMQLSNAKSFTDCEAAVYNAFELYSTVPNGIGTGRN
jgi:hypothetical protein